MDKSPSTNNKYDIVTPVPDPRFAEGGRPFQAQVHNRGLG